MYRFLLGVLLLFLVSCNKKIKQEKNIENPITSEPNESEKYNKEEGVLVEHNPSNKRGIDFSNGKSTEIFNLEETTVVVIQFDSLEITQIKEIEGESNFYTAADDLM